MREIQSIRAVFAVLVGASVVCTTLTAAHAQSNPSADDIIKMLKPTGSVGTGTRGIRPASGPAPDATVPATAPAAAPMAMPMPAAPAPKAATAAVSQPRPAAPAAPAPAAAPSANLQVQFASNSAELTPSARAALDELGRALSSNDLAGYKFRIEGHTDTVGSPEHNLALSDLRANAVVDYLVTNYHVDRSRMQAVGKGSEDLAVPTGPQVSEARNRRVQVVNLGA